jgi:predicted MFS family arabinose efflux permease
MSGTDTMRPLGRRTILLLALACGVGVANVYFPQAIIPLVASNLHVSAGAAALVATFTQLGYAAGIFLLVPLGDRLKHRGLLVTLMLLVGAGLLVASIAPALPVLIAASTFVGLVTVVPQIIIPMTAGLVEPERRGAVTGTLLSGLIGGILLARTFSGVLGQWLNWRAPYLVAAVLVLLLAVVLRVIVPDTQPSTDQPYPKLLATSVRLLGAEPDLRRSCIYQALVFAGFSGAWTALALLVTGSKYGYGSSMVGLIALVGAGSVFCTPIAGRMADRLGPDRVNLVCMIGTLVASAVLLIGVAGGPVGLVALFVGMLGLDVAFQCGQVANQTRIFALNPAMRSRLNTAYMTCSFLGGSLGSFLAVRAYVGFGWGAVCALVAVGAVLALTRHLVHLGAVARTSPAAGETAEGAVSAGRPEGETAGV